MNRPEDDKLFDKYRVFYSPEEGNPAVAVEASYRTMFGDEEVLVRMKEVTDFVFVLRPEVDEAAQVALGAYALAVRKTKPELAQDLLSVIEGYIDDSREET
jgi:hypothetical protein